MSSLRIGFIGAGRMASALAGGIVRAELAAAADVVAADPSADARSRLEADVPVRTAADNREVLKSADVVFIAVKPQHVAAALQP
ncbi:MAG: NAD(P)-binding domain-containing protein, partial [Planctomycetales bacterium]|nr:NAD(P)-binding domain-containing protein [Planctomycetales bacterium]